MPGALMDEDKDDHGQDGGEEGMEMGKQEEENDGVVTFARPY